MHESAPWRIHEVVPDFTLEDVWALPVHGGAEDFQTALEMIASFDPSDTQSLLARVLWDIRDRLGPWLDLDRVSSPVGGNISEQLPIPGTNEISLIDRLPADLRATTADLDFGRLPVVPLYRTDVEFAGEVSNRTVHGVIHLSWVEQSEGRYQGQMAIYVKPRGLLGKGYMALITPFRYLIVYPALMQQIEKSWNTRVPQ